MATLVLPRLIAERLRRLLKQSWQIYGEPVLTLPSPASYRLPFLASMDLANAGPFYRHDWRRKTLPLYGKHVLPISREPVELPKSLKFRFDDDENALRRNPELPAISLRPVAHRGDTRIPALGQGTYLLQARVNHPRRPEANRRRKDQKVPHFYRRGLRLYNRTFGEAGEYLEAIDAFRYAKGDPALFLTGLAVNEAVDRIYGTRAKVYQKLYDSGYWPFPVGISAMSRLWR